MFGEWFSGTRDLSKQVKIRPTRLNKNLNKNRVNYKMQEHECLGMGKISVITYSGSVVEYYTCSLGNAK